MEHCILYIEYAETLAKAPDPYCVIPYTLSSVLPQKTCIVIAGPTAVGKTAVSIALAQHFKTDIISADSRQCYKELNIGVAKPAPAQLQLVKHYFINSHSVTEEVNAGIFEQYALDAVQEIFLTHHTAILVGGTGLYIRAFCEGMDEIPAISADLRNEINEQYRVGRTCVAAKTNTGKRSAVVYFGRNTKPPTHDARAGGSVGYRAIDPGVPENKKDRPGF